MHDLVDLVCRDARLDGSRSNVKYFSCESAYFAHALNALLIQYIDFVSSYIWIVWYAVLRPLRMWYRLRYISLFCQRVDRSQGARVRVRGKWIEESGFWIDLRNNVRSTKVTDEVRTLVKHFMFSLKLRVSILLLPWVLVLLRPRLPTQLRLKQSCEQKKLSTPISLHLGHCNVLASLSQFSPGHLRGCDAAWSIVRRCSAGCGDGLLFRGEWQSEIV